MFSNANTPDPCRSVDDILESLQMLHEGEAKSSHPLSDEIGILQSNKSKWKKLLRRIIDSDNTENDVINTDEESIRVAAGDKDALIVSSKNAIRALTHLHKMEVINTNKFKKYKSAVKKNRLMKQIAVVLQLFSNILGSETVLFAFNAIRFAGVVGSIVAATALLLDFLLFISIPATAILYIPAIMGVLILARSLLRASAAIDPLLENIVNKSNQKSVDNYGYINSPRYRPDGLFQKISLFISKHIQTPLSNLFPAKFLTMTATVARYAFNLSVALMPTGIFSMPVLLPLAALAFVASTTAKTLLVPHIYKATHVDIDESPNSPAVSSVTEEALRNTNTPTVTHCFNELRRASPSPTHGESGIPIRAPGSTLRLTRG